MSFAEDWNSSYLPSANKTKRRILLFTKEEQKKINEAREMRGLPDLSAMMAAQLGLSSAEPLIPSSEMAATDATDTSLQRRDSSPGAAAAASKKKSKKREMIVLKEALADSDKLKKTMAAKSRLLRRKRVEWQAEYDKMAEKRDRVVAQRKAQKKS